MLRGHSPPTHTHSKLLMLKWVSAIVLQLAQKQIASGVVQKQNCYNGITA